VSSDSTMSIYWEPVASSRVIEFTNSTELLWIGQLTFTPIFLEGEICYGLFIVYICGLSSWLTSKNACIQTTKFWVFIFFIIDLFFDDCSLLLIRDPLSVGSKTLMSFSLRECIFRDNGHLDFTSVFVVNQILLALSRQRFIESISKSLLFFGHSKFKSACILSSDSM